ncbi:MAG: hypothetical protein DRJ41_04115 [Thermoprotei archaeon]|nr:MAG: hypothetical protein DRJ41_04115 [Thermoprotei archaeon]
MSCSDNKRVKTDISYSENELKSLIGSSGTVKDSYGGFEIIILDPSSFPWNRVLTKLLEISSDVWVRKEKDKIKIITKPLCE